MLAAVGGAGVQSGAVVSKVIVPALVAPGLAFLVAGLAILVIYRLVGRRRPPVSQSGGRGHWLVNQMCDLVQVRSSRAGTTVRFFVGPT
jgi:phosphate/sulfate permease